MKWQNPDPLYPTYDFVEVSKTLRPVVAEAAVHKTVCSTLSSSYLVFLRLVRIPIIVSVSFIV